MSERKTITHKAILMTGLIVSVAALPFSLKICHAGMIMILTGWFFEGRWRQKLHIVNRSILLQLTLALFLVLAAGVAYSESFQTGWFTAEKKIFFLLMPIALATTVIKLTGPEIKIIVYGFLISCFIASALCILNAWNQASILVAGDESLYQYLGITAYKDLNPFDSEKWLIFSYASLSEGINIHPTYLSLYLGFCIIFLLHQAGLAKSVFVKISFGTLGLYFALFVIFLASRIVILGLSIVFIFILIRSLMDKQRSLALMVMVIVSLFYALLLTNPVTRYRSLQEIALSTFKIQPDHEYQNATQIRISLWWLAIQSLEPANLIWGVGTGDVKKVMERTSRRYNITNVIGSFDPHNQYFYTLLGNGILGLIVLILCLGLPGYFAWLQRDFMFMGFSFLFLLLCLTESALELQKGVGFYTLFVSLFSFQMNSFQNFSMNVRPLIRANH